MNSDTGELGVLHAEASLEEVEVFRRKFDMPLTNEEYDHLKPMNREKRREWARKNKKCVPKIEVTLKTLDERMQRIERKLDHIFGKSVLVNGRWVDIK